MRQHALPVGSVSGPQVGDNMVYGFTERFSPTKRYQQTTLADLLKGSVHEGVLAQILLGGTQHDDLLQFLGVCAQVSRAWIQRRARESGTPRERRFVSQEAFAATGTYLLPCRQSAISHPVVDLSVYGEASYGTAGA